MTKEWTFDQPLDEKEQTTSAEERAKIAALFQKPNDEVDYVAAFEMEQQKATEKPVSKSEPQIQQKQEKTTPSTITSDYKQHLAHLMAQNTKDIAKSQKKIEELHQLIDEKNKHNKKLQAISAAIDDL